MLILFLIGLIFGIIFGYNYGHKQGYRLGVKEGIAEAPLLIMEKNMLTGYCQICSKQDINA